MEEDYTVARAESQPSSAISKKQKSEEDCIKDKVYECSTSFGVKAHGREMWAAHNLTRRSY